MRGRAMMSTSCCTSRRFRRIPATSSGCAPTPARRCTWSSRWDSAWTTGASSAPASTITISPRCDVHADLEACLRFLGDARLLAVETGGRRCYADFGYRAGRCAGVRTRDPRACPGGASSASGAKIRCTFPCGRRAEVSTYRTPWRWWCTRRGGSSASRCGWRRERRGVSVRSFRIGRATLLHADALDWMRTREPCSVHAIVTDPPYGLIEYSDQEQAKLRRGRGGVWRIPPPSTATGGPRCLDSPC